MSASERLRDVFHAVALTVLAVTALTLGRDILVPVATAVLVWFLINAMAGALRSAVPALPEGFCTLIAVAVLTLVVLAVVQVVSDQVGALSEGFEGVESALGGLLDATETRLGLQDRLDFEALLGGLDLPEIARVLFDRARGLASDFSLVLLYVMFLLLDQRFYPAKLRALAPDPVKRERLAATLRRVAGDVRVYLWLMTLVSAGVGLLTWLICEAFGVPGAGFWGFVAFGLNYIPVIGTIVAVVLPSLYALTQFADASLLIPFVLLLGCVQFLAGEVVLPRLMGDRLNLSGFVILLSLVVWGWMWGPAGMFLAVPITVILTLVFAQFGPTRSIAVALSKTGAPPAVEHGEAGPEWRDRA